MSVIGIEVATSALASATVCHGRPFIKHLGCSRRAFMPSVELCAPSHLQLMLHLAVFSHARRLFRPVCLCTEPQLAEPSELASFALLLS